MKKDLSTKPIATEPITTEDNLVSMIYDAVLATRHIITRDSVTLYYRGAGKNALDELNTRIEEAVLKYRNQL